MLRSGQFSAIDAAHNALAEELQAALGEEEAEEEDSE